MSGAAHKVAGPLVQDALCELVHIGAGHALTSLSQMLGGARIGLSLPQCTGADGLPPAPDLDGPGVLVGLRVRGRVGCTLFALFEENSARRLGSELLGHPQARDELGVLEESALLEAMNVISCAFLGALATMLKTVLVPSPPFVEYGQLFELLGRHAPAGQTAVINGFEDLRGGFRGRLLISTDDRAWLTDALGVRDG